MPGANRIDASNEWRERRLASTDDDRDHARAQLRVAQARYHPARHEYRDALSQRDRAVGEAREVGLSIREITRLIGLNGHNQVQKIIDRYRQSANTTDPDNA